MKYLLAIVIIGLIAYAPKTIAAVSEEQFEQIQQQLALMSGRLDKLEAENQELRAAQSQVEVAVDEVETNLASVQSSDLAVPEESWNDRVKLDGDFRYRYESISVEDSQTRQRNRIRARTNITAKVADNIKVGFGLATGGDDPVSANQTLGGGGSSKNIQLNLAYVDWEIYDGLHLIAGKIKNPLYRAGKQGLMWDSDWTPEGVGFTYENDLLFVNALGSFLESDSRLRNDSTAFAGQFGLQGKIGGADLLGGVGYYSLEAAGKSTTFGDPSDPGDFYGNTAIQVGGLPCGTIADVDCVYRYDYVLTEAFAEASFAVGGMPVKVFGNFVNNSDAPTEDTAWLLGAHVGEVNDRGQWQLTYLYSEKEADSMLGLLTDSNFAGGGTDGKGHLLQFNWGVSKTWTVGARYFINELDVASGSGRDYDRLILDTQWKWK